MTDLVLATLTKRRAELAAEAHAADAALRRILTEIDHMDGAIRLCDPAYRPRARWRAAVGSGSARPPDPLCSVPVPREAGEPRRGPDLEAAS